MPERQIDRVLSAYHDAGIKSESSPGSPLLPQIQQYDDESFMDDESNSFSRFILEHFSRQSLLFGSFFAIVHFSVDVLRPYLSVYYSQLGFSADEIGIISSIQPFFAIFYIPLIGIIADRFAIGRFILVLSLVLSSGAHMAMFYTPNVRTKDCFSSCNVSSKAGDDFENCFSAVNEMSSSAKVKSNDIYNSHDLRTVFLYLIAINVLVLIASAPWYPIATGYLLAALGPENRDEFGYFKGVGGIGSSLG